jgi:ferredoxin
MVKVKIDKETCTGCGTCAAICDEVFELGDDSKAKLTEKYKSGEVPDDIECVDPAIESCAVSAISKE